MFRGQSAYRCSLIVFLMASMVTAIAYEWDDGDYVVVTFGQSVARTFINILLNWFKAYSFIVKLHNNSC